MTHRAGVFEQQFLAKSVRTTRGCPDNFSDIGVAYFDPASESRAEREERLKREAAGKSLPNGNVKEDSVVNTPA